MQIVQKYAEKGNKNPFIAITDHQTEGTGRNDRVWIDTPKASLLFSILFQIPPSSIATFADLVSLTVCQTIHKETNIPLIRIKYPNDLVIVDKKLAGILVKNMYDKKLQYLGTNVGIGINIHYTEDMLKTIPADYPATSLDIWTNAPVNRQTLLIEIIHRLQYLSTEIVSISVNPVAAKPFEQKWRESSSILEKKVKILKQGKTITKGLVTNTALGRGIELETSTGKKWFSLFDSEMKLRIE